MVLLHLFYLFFNIFHTHTHKYIHTFRHFELIQYSFYLLLDDSSIFSFFLSFSLGEWHRALHKYIYSLEFFLYFTFNILIYWRDSKNAFRLLHTEKEKKNFSFIVAWQIKKKYGIFEVNVCMMAWKHLPTITCIKPSHTHTHTHVFIESFHGFLIRVFWARHFVSQGIAETWTKYMY